MSASAGAAAAVPPLHALNTAFEWRDHTGPCRVVAPVLEEIASEREDLRIVKLNVDENQQTAATFQVLSIPTMILFKGGQAVKTVVGAYPKKKIEAELDPVLTAA